MANPLVAGLGLQIRNLKEFVEHNSSMIGGANENVVKLCDDLETLGQFSRRYSEEDLDQHSDKYFPDQLAKNITDIVLEAEDAIETYFLCVFQQKKRSSFAKTVHLFDFTLDLRNLIKRIELVRDKMKYIYEKAPSIGITVASRLQEMPDRSVHRHHKGKDLVVWEDDVVGFEDEASKVIELLTGGSDEMQAISIIGMHGLGKTTLARKVFSDPKIEYEFITRVFVVVSHKYERREVFLDLLRPIVRISLDITRMPESELVKMLREELEQSKYLIVLDDVWSAEAWDDLKDAFPRNNKRSRVLITSENKPVAFYANPKTDPHYLRFLYLEESRELLRRRIFGENCCPSELQGYEIRILDRCDGLPLAIVIVAGILLNNRERSDWWKKVAEDVDKFLQGDQQRYEMTTTLSFNQLPPYLKPCFLYLGVFREDFEIPVWKLLRLWIAEGFIERGDGHMNLEDIAENYLEELVDRNLVMVEQRRYNGQTKTCRIHDILRNFCRKEAMKLNLFQEIKRDDQYNLSSKHPSSGNGRRLCINSSVFYYTALKPYGQNVRSFLSFAKEETTLPLEHISGIPKAFRLLRVLDVRSIIFNRIPLELLYLILLKYIAISCHSKILPEKMSNLQNLQTLIFETTSRTLEIRADIWKMDLLRHLHTNASTFLQKVKGDYSSINGNLQTLSLISPESCKKEVFQRTPKLKKLGICGKLISLIEDKNESGSFDSFAKLEHLVNLKLLNDDITSTSRLPALLNLNMFPRSLTKLTLSNTLLQWNHMSTLGKLQKLEVLKLKDNAFTGEVWETEHGGFRHLKVLHIGQSNLVIWDASASHFPALKFLYLRHCNKLHAVPLDLAEITSLLNIDLYCTNAAAASCCRKIQLIKLQMQAMRKEDSTRTSVFKLSIYPPYQ